jgi:hypothetical protein
MTPEVVKLGSGGSGKTMRVALCFVGDRERVLQLLALGLKLAEGAHEASFPFGREPK